MEVVTEKKSMGMWWTECWWTNGRVKSLNKRKINVRGRDGGTVEKLWGNHEDKLTIRGIKSCKHRSTR